MQLDQDAITIALHTNGVSYGGAAQANGYGVVPTLNVATADNKVFIITFTGNTDVGADGFQSLKDGVYDLNINAAKVHQQGSPAVTMGGTSTTVSIACSATPAARDHSRGRHDGVDFRPSSIPATTWSSAAPSTTQAGYKAYLDFNGDGVINTGDNLQFRTRFNKSLTWKV